MQPLTRQDTVPDSFTTIHLPPPARAGRPGQDANALAHGDQARRTNSAGPQSLHQPVSTAPDTSLEQRVFDAAALVPRASLTAGGRARSEQLLVQVEESHQAAVRKSFLAMSRHDPSVARLAMGELLQLGNKLVSLRAEFQLNVDGATRDECRFELMTWALKELPVARLQAFNNKFNASHLKPDSPGLPGAGDYKFLSNSVYDLGRRMMIHAVEQALRESGALPAAITPQANKEDPAMVKALVAAKEAAATAIWSFNSFDRRKDLYIDEKLDMYFAADERLQSAIDITPQQVLSGVGGEELAAARSRARAGTKSLFEYRNSASPQDQADELSSATTAALARIDKAKVSQAEKHESLKELEARFLQARDELLKRCPLAELDGARAMLEAQAYMRLALSRFQ